MYVGTRRVYVSVCELHFRKTISTYKTLRRSTLRGVRGRGWKLYEACGFIGKKFLNVVGTDGILQTVFRE